MNTCLDRVYAIILAAGASSRLGSPKQLVPWQNLTLLEHALHNAQSLLPGRVSVVLGAHADSIQASIDLSEVTIVNNPDWQAGMASSICAGIQALPASAEATLILLCDQPLVTRAHLQQLLNVWASKPNQIVASAYHQARGVPALFPASYFGHLLKLTGDHGAKALLQQFSAQVTAVALPEAELDIDCAADVARLIQFT
jgi:molybdenum cofactor cytidylyltransferase